MSFLNSPFTKYSVMFEEPVASEHNIISRRIKDILIDYGVDPYRNHPRWHEDAAKYNYSPTLWEVIFNKVYYPLSVKYEKITERCRQYESADNFQNGMKVTTKLIESKILNWDINDKESEIGKLLTKKLNEIMLKQKLENNTT